MTWCLFLPPNERIYRLTGRDALDLLQRISTNDLAAISAGHSVSTILTNEKGRVVDVVGIHADSANALLMTTMGDVDGSTGKWIERFIIMEDLVVEDVTNSYRTAVSFDWDASLVRWNDPPKVSAFASIPARIWNNRWHTLILTRAQERSVSEEVVRSGGTLLTQGGFHDHRIMAGIPWTRAELTDERHPLEARMRSLISFTKGCYVGQEVVARLDTYRKVQQILTRFTGAISSSLSLPAPLTNESGQNAGMITSIHSTGDQRARALGFLRISFARPEFTFTTPAGETLKAQDVDQETGIYQDVP